MRRNVLRIIDAALEDPSISLCANDIVKKNSILETLHLLNESWKNVSPGKPHDLSEEKYDDWINIDANLEVACKPIEEDMCAELMRANIDDPAESDSDDESGDESDDWPLSNKEIIDMVVVLRKAVQHHTDGAFFLYSLFI